MILELREGQQEAYDIMRSGENFFLSGDAGTGKTELLRKFINDSRKDKLKVVVCAPTGLAADKIGGTTIHRAFGYPTCVLNSSTKEVEVDIKEKDSDENMKIRSHRFVTNGVLDDANIVIIDEISSVRLDLFQLVTSQIMDENRRRETLGSGSPIQLVVSGDFAQTKPVYTSDDERNRDDLKLVKLLYKNVKEGYSFESENWNKMNFVVKHLTEVIRQEDKTFSHVLKCLRLGKEEGIKALDWLNKNIKIRKWDGEAVVICGTKKEVDMINEMKYKELKGEGTNFIEECRMNEGYRINNSDRRNSKVVSLKVGAQVMCLINEKDAKYKNGSIGEITKINKDTVSVKFDNGEFEFTKYTWDIKDGFDNKIGEVTQIPLTLAYAITVHKAQGQTFEKVCIKPSIYFDEAMHYVAVSRVKTLDGLQLYDGEEFTDIVTFSSGYQRPIKLTNDTVRKFLINNNLV